jgi:ppGpp synthetase/RelA/SpoT-type nucleotidyltranferase
MSELETQYRERYNRALTPISAAIESLLRDYLGKEKRIDRIAARPKSVERFMAKSEALKEDGTPKYRDPLAEIQDQVGARVITFYTSDVLRIASRVEKFFHAIEAKDRVPESESEFGYFGRHYVFLVPTDAIAGLERSLLPRVFELQIKTLFQHAWSEANHDLGYKPEGEALTREEKRKLAFTSAQAWGADLIFEELFRARSQP